MANDKQDESFKVIDRRLFTPEGELRKEALEEEAATEAKSAPPAAAAAPEGRAPAPDAPPASQRTDAAPKTSPNFRRLVESLAQNAAMLLGGYADPRTGQAILDLDGARELIDMLDAVCEKTTGNLTAEEERFLLDVLGSLKLSFMEMSKAAAQAVRENAARKPQP